MDNFLFLKIAKNRNSGLCNQLYNLVGAIEYCIKNNKKYLIIDRFLKQIDSEEYCPINKIIDLPKFNSYLLKHNITLFDKINTTIELVSLNIIITENKTEKTTINLDNLLPTFVSNNVFNIPKNRSFITEIIEKYDRLLFNRLFDLQVNYKINGLDISDIIFLNNGVISDDYVLNLNINNHTFVESPILYYGHSSYPKLFSDIFKNITFKEYFNTEKLFKDNINLSVIHLRLENDAITHISSLKGKEEGETKREFENKYIEMIEKYIGNSNDEIKNVLLLTDDYNNEVVKFLSSNSKYNLILFIKTYKFRELNAIRDLLLSENCNRCFIGVMESSFSYGVMFRISKQVKDYNENHKCVIFDMLDTSRQERVYNSEKLINSTYQ